MTPSLGFWTAALIDLVAVAILLAVGIRSARRGEWSRHGRCMKRAATLVALFLLIYPLKVIFFGREQLSEWSEPAVAALRVHEVCVSAMLAGGLTALWLARTLRPLCDPGIDVADAPRPARRTVRGHRLAGRIAALGAGFALLTAAIVLAGMYGRAIDP